MKSAATSPPELLSEGDVHQLGGRLREAAECFALAIDAASATDAPVLVAAGLRRLGIVHHLQGETATGMHYCRRSRAMALASCENLLAAEATMALANMACEQGAMDEARELYRAALALVPENPDLAARIEQNLGIVESVQGNLSAALTHYRQALQAYEVTHDILGRARSHHNIGMISVDQRDWNTAQHAFDLAAVLARQGGDYHLTGLCLLNHSEIDLAHQRYEEVRRRAEAALDIFERLGARTHMADAFRMLGTAFRFLKRPALAESRLRSALEIATTAGVPLTEAESCRDMAALLTDVGRQGEALTFFDRALALFGQLGAALDVAEVSKQRAALVAA